MAAADVLYVAIELANAIRLVLAAYEGEPKVIIASRKLAYSCLQYQDSVTDLLKLLQRSGGDANPRFKLLCDQVKNDTLLMKEIKDQTDSINKSAGKNGQWHNTFKTLFTGRLEKVKELEGELLSRVHMISLEFVRLQAAGSTREQQDNAFMLKTINDCDGVLFWDGYFGRDRTVSFQRFMEAYQSYLTHTFLFRRLKTEHLVTLLRCTLLEDHMASASTSGVMQAEVSMTAFANWLKLFGPMKETLSKAAAVSNPTSEVSLVWFQRSADRNSATNSIANYVSNLTSAAVPERMFIVRYSSKPEYHFVVTVLSPSVGSVQHLPILNTPVGYVIAGETCAFAPTLLECLQINLFDKLFDQNTTGSEDKIELSRRAMDEWDRLFAEVTAVLPDNHYPDMSTVIAATALLDLGLSDDGKTSSSLSGFFGPVSGKTSPVPADKTKADEDNSPTAVSSVQLDLNENPTTVNVHKRPAGGPCLCM